MGRNPRGFTLLELMMALALIGIILAFAIPSFSSFRKNARMTSAANDLLADLNMARTEAIKRQRNVAFCGSGAPRAAEPACDPFVSGWLVWVDNNNDGDIDAGEPLVTAHDPLPDALQVASNFEVISYGADGFARLQPTTAVLLCDDRGNAPAGDFYRKRIVALNATGRPWVARSVADVASLTEPAEPAGDAVEIDENWLCPTGS
jgi:type IV fimbrial biogenesis protein FimT